MLHNIGIEVPFPYFGPSVAFIVFSVVLIIVEGIILIFQVQNTIW